MFTIQTILTDLQLFKRLPKYGEGDELELQVRLCKMLGLAFALSITGVGGVGSLLALVQGLRVRRVINQHRGKFGGISLAWWCIVVGALGTLLLPPAIAFSVWK